MQRDELEKAIRNAIVDYNTLPNAVGTDVSAYVAEHVFKAQPRVSEDQQAMWDALGILGFDLDGNPTPAPCLSKYNGGDEGFRRQFLEDIREARKDADECLDEIDKAERHADMYRRHRNQADSLLGELVDESFEKEIAYALAVRHKCLEHAGPGSGPCKTDRERARIVLRLIAAKINTRLDFDEEDS